MIWGLGEQETKWGPNPVTQSCIAWSFNMTTVLWRLGQFSCCTDNQRAVWQTLGCTAGTEIAFMHQQLEIRRVEDLQPHWPVLHDVEGFGAGAPGYSSTRAEWKWTDCFYLPWLEHVGTPKCHKREHRSGSPLSAGLPVFSQGSWNFWCNTKLGQGAIQVPLICLFSVFPFFSFGSDMETT